MEILKCQNIKYYHNANFAYCMAWCDTWDSFMSSNCHSCISKKIASDFALSKKCFSFDSHSSLRYFDWKVQIIT